MSQPLHEVWQRGHLVDDGTIFERDMIVLFAHHSDCPSEKREALRDVSVIDTVDQAILRMMGVDITAN